VNFAPPSILAHVGDVINFQVVITNATRVGSVPFHVAYDPALLRFVPPAAEGDFLKRDGATTIFNAQASTQNEIFVALSRLGAPTGISDGGVLCSLSFEALAAGNSQLSFTQASVLDPQGQPLPANFSGGLQVMIQEAPR
jgi:general secretion pathway protein D